MNHWPECIDDWNRAPLGPGDIKLFQMKSLGSCKHVWPRPRGINGYTMIFREILKNLKNCSTKWDNS